MPAAAVNVPAKAKAKAPKDAKSKKSSFAAPRKARAYPPYSEMIREAIMALKERTGSSQIAIAKFIEEKQKPNLPANFKKLLLVQLKKLVSNGRLVKVKNSFKLPPKSASNESLAKTVKKPVVDKRKAEGVGKKKGTPVKKKVVAKSTKAARKSPGKKAAVAPKKRAPVRGVKKPKNIKSPVKKARVKKDKK